MSRKPGGTRTGDPRVDSCRALLDTNLNIIPHPCSLQHAEFLIRDPSHLRHKAHSSVILHFTDPDAANSCIAHQVSLHGWLLCTIKFIQNPPSCYHCHQLGHFAWDCKLKHTCRLCAGAHDSCTCNAAPSDLRPPGQPQQKPHLRATTSIQPVTLSRQNAGNHGDGMSF